MTNRDDIPIDVVPDSWMGHLDKMVGTITDYQKANPAYVPFAPGTPTLARREFDEGTRRFDAELGEKKRQFDEGTRRFDAELGEKKRQFDVGLAEDRRQFGAKLAASAKSGSSAKPTEKERSLGRNAGLFDEIEALYHGYRKEGIKHPLGNTIEELLYSPEWEGAFRESGVDRIGLIEDLIRLHGTAELKTPDEYFSRGYGQRFQPWYEAINKKDDEF